MDRAADLVNATDTARSQIEALVKVVDDQTITKAADALNQKLMAVEENLVELKARAGGGRAEAARGAARDLPLFNELLRQGKVPQIITTEAR
jgi:hypothetical protein